MRTKVMNARGICDQVQQIHFVCKGGVNVDSTSHDESTWCAK